MELLQPGLFISPSIRLSTEIELYIHICMRNNIFVDIGGAWPTFVMSITFIGLLTMVIGDIASAFGCTISMKDPITAITFVAIGTSIPGLFTRWQHLFASQASHSVCTLV